EIYFDSYGRFRKRKKTAKLDEVFRLENVKNFKRSFDFIQQSLLPYQKQLFYIPGLKRDVLVDVGITPVDNKKSTVKRVVFDGQEISYTEDGETFIANTDADSQIAQNVKNFEQELAQQMATPKRRLCVTYSEEATQDLLLTVPFSYKIQRFSV
ncbi:MAG: hypothetical protein GY950_18340, partial [bacterium]|nr:hypothetical protein [bacterium]